MLGKKKTSIGTNNEGFDTIIANNTSITGDITAEGNVRIDGSYKGDINSNSEVIIGDEGYIQGNVNARSVSVSGKIEGNVRCQGLLEIYSHGVVEGDISIKSLSIVEGGKFNGKCSMDGEVNQVESLGHFEEESGDSFEIIGD